MIGYAKENADTLASAIAYLNEHKSRESRSA